MAFDPDVGDAVLFGQVQRFGPQVGVQRGGLVRLFPAAGPPALGPAFFQPVDDVLAVRAVADLAGLFQKAHRLDEGGQLHPVVGGGRVAAAQLLFKDLAVCAAVPQHRPPAAGAGVAAAGAVGVDLNFFHGILLSQKPGRRAPCIPLILEAEGPCCQGEMYIS